MGELWQLYDYNENPLEILDKTNPRVWDKGVFHMGADVWIVNSENNIFIQKRAACKRLEPNVWGMTGGSVVLGENPIETIVRESKEELGIDVRPDELKFMTEFKVGDVWLKTYTLKYNYDLSKMVLCEEEVSEVKWATWDEIDELVNTDNFINNRWEFVKDFLKKEVNYEA